MPWNSEGGGGNQGPWGQGPWGQGGGGPRRPNPPGRGPTPPDLDDLIRKSQDRLKQVLPRGGGAGLGWLLAVAFVAIVVAYNSVYQVQPDERGVVLRFGTFNRVAEPGLHFALWPVETMEKPRVGAVRQINIGNEGNEGQMLTSDKNIIGVPFSVFWRINDAKNYLFNVADQERTIRSVAQSAMREVVGQTRAQGILTTGKNAVEAQVMEITQKLLDEYGAGVTITSVNLGDVQPPREVADAFAEVVRAGQNQQQLINEAEQYRNQQLRLADGEAAKLIEDANAYKSATVSQAEGEAARFLSVYEQYEKAQGVTRERIFLETMEQILGQTNKVIMEQGGGGTGVVPYLPLPELKARQGDQQN
ncbi:FtsH protease activity modulator HflK [Aestuariivirga sp.]|jgi:membrane protease subunit HflK|uniref:FtsH protease activity modulator HflK n=1 Tax=Aestuariivirga sp. TaxID=2650926 RepID=UPI003784E07D